jgi:transposase
MLFETLDRPALRPLPAQPSEYAAWQLARVNIDYHVEVEGHYYSVPYTLVRQQLDVRLRASVVELFAKGNVSPATGARPTKAAIVRWLSICRVRTNSMRNGRPSA